MRDEGAEYTIDTAIYMNDVPFVEKCLATDAPCVNQRRGALRVPLRLAARIGPVEICKLLLEHGAGPNAFEEGMGYPILVDAVKHLAVVKLLIVAVLLENDASVSFLDRSGKTPLELADALKCPEEIRKLIRRKTSRDRR
jgi:ankyrin repeat protein